MSSGQIAVTRTDIDARPFLPAPPGPIDPAPVERKLRDELAGSLPNEHSSIPHVPRTVLESVTFEDVIPGVFYMSCGLGTDGAVFCWGYNQEGELGNGTFNESLTPTRVVPPAP